MNLNSDTWCDLVFEGKNKEYGAYHLRKTSSKRHVYALIITIGIVVLILSLYYVWKIPKTYEIELKPINISELSMIEMEYTHLEELEKPKPEEIKPEEIAKNTPPKIVSDEEEIPEPVEQKEIASIPADSVGLTAADSILLAEHKLRISGMIDEPVTYMLNPADSTQKSSSLQTTILRHVYRNLQFPEVAYKQRIKGKVIYSFIVNKDGSISDITLEKGVYIFLDEEVLRVINSLPILEPEKKDGKPIRVKFYLPVVFS